MSIRKNIDLLRRVPAFSQVERAHVQLIMFSAPMLNIAARQTLMLQGDKNDAAYLVLDGRADVLMADGDGEEKMAEIGRGAFVGELSMIARLAYHVTVRARTSMTVVKIPNDLFMRVVKEFPEVGAKVIDGLADRLDDNVRELADVRDLFNRSEKFPSD